MNLHDLLSVGLILARRALDPSVWIGFICDHPIRLVPLKIMVTNTAARTAIVFSTVEGFLVRHTRRCGQFIPDGVISL